MSAAAADHFGGDVAVYLTEADVAELVTIEDAMAALEEVLPQEPSGDAVNVAKTLSNWEPSSSAHAVGAYSRKEKLVLFKTWVNTPRGATAAVTMFSYDDGSLAAVMEATTLGALRTAGISGLATKWLSDGDADELAVLGTGRQALAQVAAIAAVRPLARVRMFSPNAERRRAFVARASDTVGCEIQECANVDECLADAPIVSLLTRAREPIVSLAQLSEGAHINALGAVLPANAELEADVLRAAELVVVDSVTNVRLTSREFHEGYGEDPKRWAAVRSLGELVASGKGRQGNERLTLFKSAGMGLSDLAVAVRAYRAARDRGAGVSLGQPTIQALRWGSGALVSHRTDS